MIEPGAKNLFTRIFWIIILLGALAVMFQIWRVPVRDLSQDEGLFAAIASSMDHGRPLCTAHGVGIKNRYFLYPLLSSLLHNNFNIPISTALRYINFFFMAMTALLLGITAGLTRNFKAGLIAAAFFAANFFVYTSSINANPLMFGIFFLTMAQIAWIYFGFSKGKWNLAWISSFLFISLGFLGCGFKLIMYFFIPLFFMHRPLKFSSKANKKGFLFGIFLLITAFMIWFMPRILFANDYYWDYIPYNYRGMSNFLLNIIISPLQLLLSLMPWTLLIWMPFCVAIRPLDETPIFSHYFRVIFISIFTITLINPFSTMEDFLFALPSLAMLCALCYDTAVRRYSKEIRRLAVFCGYITAILAAGLVIYCFCPYENLIKYVKFLPLDKKEHIFSAILAFFGISIWIYYYRKHGQIWLIMLITGVSVGFFYNLTFLPYNVADRTRSKLGRDIGDIVHKDSGTESNTIYKNNILDLYSESYYMNAKINKIQDFNDIDKDAEVIYLLTTGFPEFPDRTWKNLFETVYRGRKLYLYRGEKAKNIELFNRRNHMLQSNQGKL